MIKFVTGKLIKRFSSKTMSAAQKRALAKAVKASAAARKLSTKTTTKVVSKRTAKKLNKLSARISANKSAIKRNATGKDSVIRLQREDGSGFAMKRIVPPKKVGTHKGKPFPVQPSQDIKKLRKAFEGKPIEFETLDFDQSMNFGFKDYKQANKYFTKSELDWYKKRNYTLQKVSNVKINAVNNSQLAFTTSKALMRSQKESLELARKYEKLSRR
jgi:hypothetical protein